MGNLQSHQKKKPNKKQAEKLLVDSFESQLKKMNIKGMIQGSEIMAQTILDFIKANENLDFIKHYCETILKSSKDGTMEKVVNK